MRAWPRFAFALVAVVLVAALSAACSDDDDDDDAGATSTATGTATATATGTATEAAGAGGQLAVLLKEWALEPAAPSLEAGSVTFATTNDGGVPHELVVFRTDLDVEVLPTSSGQVDETQVEVLGRTAQLLAGESEDLVAELTPGSYALVCNIAGHYDLGMRVAFRVE
ncbi:MAG: hypothetical protein O2895_01285 [Chloroflexi bacterium]|nr:hypothetical protein [Chloroflexota bacterium]